MRVMVTSLLLCAACGADDDVHAPPEPPVLYAGDVWGGNLAIADDQVYFTTFTYGDGQDHAVWRVPTSGGPSMVIWHGAPEMIFGIGMAVHDGEVFWSQEDGPTPAVFSAPIDGGARTELGRFTTAQAPYTGIGVNDDWIFAGSHDQIVRIPRRGGDAVVVFSGSVQWIALHDDVLYFSSAGTLLLRMPAAGGEPEPVATIAGLETFVIDGSAAYAPAGDAVWIVPLDGSPPTMLADGLARARQIAKSPDAIFTTIEPSDEGPTLIRVPLDGSTPQPLYDVPIDFPTLLTEGSSLYAAYCCGLGIGGGAVIRLDL